MTLKPLTLHLQHQNLLIGVSCDFVTGFMHPLSETAQDTHGSHINASIVLDTPPSHITLPQESPMSTRSVEGLKLGPTWRRLLDLGSEIDRWRFVADYDNLTEMVWDIWKPRHSDQSFHSFSQVLREEIA